jgi:signal transduction histidine kinase
LLPLVVLLAVNRSQLPVFVFQHVIVLLVAACAIGWGVRVALVSAIVAVAAENVLLQDPIGRPAITGVRDAVDLVLFVVVAVIVGWLVASERVQRQRAERAVERELRAREERDGLIATIAHDLATPLNVIRGSLQLAQRSGSNATYDMDKLLQRLNAAAARASSLLATLRDTQAIERGELSVTLTDTDLRAVVRPTARMFDRVSERHPVLLNIPDVPIMIHADPDRLQRLLENLLTNAIKYSPAGGVVEVDVGVEDASAVVRVRDHGIGISPAALPHIFKGSFRAPEALATAPGLGLGLSIAKEIADRHGATIEACQAKPAGTVFSLRIPLRHSGGSSERSAAAYATAASSTTSAA